MRWSGLRREPGGAPTTTITTAMTAAPHHSGNSLVRGVRRGKGRALWQWRGGRGRRGLPPGRPLAHLPFFSCTPRMRDILPRICGLGMALPFSYSLMICGFSLIACADQNGQRVRQEGQPRQPTQSPPWFHTYTHAHTPTHTRARAHTAVPCCVCCDDIDTLGRGGCSASALPP